MPLPLAARCTNLKEGDWPNGTVWQAEEVLENGQWKRYYGFVGHHRLVRVGATDIEFPPGDGKWLHLGKGLKARLEGPTAADLDAEGSPRFAWDAEVKISLFLRNPLGVDSIVSLDTPPRLRLWYSPEAISRKGMLVAEAREDRDWIEVKAKKEARWPIPVRRTLAPAEEIRAGHINPRDWFRLDRPGFYRLQMMAGDPKKAASDEGSVEIRFSLAPARK